MSTYMIDESVPAAATQLIDKMVNALTKLLRGRCRWGAACRDFVKPSTSSTRRFQLHDRSREMMTSENERVPATGREHQSTSIVFPSVAGSPSLFGCLALLLRQEPPMVVTSLVGLCCPLKLFTPAEQQPLFPLFLSSFQPSLSILVTSLFSVVTYHHFGASFYQPQQVISQRIPPIPSPPITKANQTARPSTQRILAMAKPDTKHELGSGNKKKLRDSEAYRAWFFSKEKAEQKPDEATEWLTEIGRLSTQLDGYRIFIQDVAQVPFAQSGLPTLNDWNQLRIKTEKLLKKMDQLMEKQNRLDTTRFLSLYLGNLRRLHNEMCSLHRHIREFFTAKDGSRCVGVVLPDLIYKYRFSDIAAPPRESSPDSAE
ncbi:hypothetical protein BJ508DRAFT_311789 [Ascobolus immersus RN42]|uniref:Uncharacterized protein n=1 Tax=Ascobolus immersus RN42 TaxID=1160509 RepID=A0A3N4HT56_ASCIM|nr:hypothetical protein BJ508DRAFT_311789 [Ascobolus immersus RN42]